MFDEVSEMVECGGFGDLYLSGEVAEVYAGCFKDVVVECSSDF